jgi:hypothetical protein
MTEESPFKRILTEALLGRGEDVSFEALGRFVTAYATAESGVHILARTLSGLADEKARIVFGGMRLTDAIDCIRANDASRCC